MLESLESETPNIKDLSIEEESAELKFNYREIVDESVWRSLTSVIEQINQDPGSSTDSKLARQRSILVKLFRLFPEKRAQVSIDPDLFLDLKKSLELNLQKPNTAISAAGSAEMMTVLYPDEIPSFNLEDNLKDNLLMQINEYRVFVLKREVVDTLRNYARYASNYVQLFREYSRLQLDSNLQQTLIDAIDEVSALGPESLSMYLAELKILFPEAVGKGNIIKQVHLNLIQHRLKELKNSNMWVEFELIATSYKIIAARNITLTDHGLELDMGYESKFTQSPPTMPETRSF